MAERRFPALEWELVAEAEQHLRSVANLVKCHGRAILSRFEITPPQFEALLVMLRHPNLTMGELCQRLDLASSTVTDLVDRMERNRLVERVRDPEDRRVIRLRLLPRAQELLDAVLEARRAYLADVLRRLDPVDRRVLLRSLQRLDAAMRGQEVQAPLGGRTVTGRGDWQATVAKERATAGCTPAGGGGELAMRLAIIGGTGVYDPEILENVREETVVTPYGRATVRIGTFRDQEVVFLARHGTGHTVPPHRINYRANIYALAALGVQRVIATAAVGSIRREFGAGHFVLVDQFLDFTKNRVSTFFEGGEEGVVHVDVTEPYCPQLRATLHAVGRELGIPVHNGGVYVCTEGPRFETAAEIRAFERLGGDVVGMTSVPEVVLAREAGLCYATVAMVTNYAAGLSGAPLTHEEVLEVMASNVVNLRRLILEAIPRLAAERSCPCAAKPAPLRVGREGQQP
ncbi:MAG: S-methyl-5'-thioadenosine phosphorylase [Bacillota bacterium]|nr:MAG: S-methyl-5'-thioadenosine phosphorylase [Bacillota bacterium]